MSTSGSPDTHIQNNINGQLSAEAQRYELAQAATLSSRLEAFGSRKPSDHSIVSHASVSSPPNKKKKRRVDVDLDVDLSLALRPQNPSDVIYFNRPAPPERLLFLDLEVDMPEHTTPPPPPSNLASKAPATNGTTPKAQTESNVEWTVEETISRLDACRQDVKRGHAQLTGYILESTKATEHRVRHGKDLFANIRTPVMTEKGTNTIRIRSKVRRIQSIQTQSFCKLHF